MHLKDPVEVLYFSLMWRWENTAPPNGRKGLLDNKPERNTQISRMVYLLRKVAAGVEEKTYNTLARYSCRKDGESYVSRNPAWMEEPRELCDGWYLEGCMSLIQKQEVLEGLRKIGLSSLFVSCADDFVSGKSIYEYFPTK